MPAWSRRWALLTPLGVDAVVGVSRFHVLATECCSLVFYECRLWHIQADEVQLTQPPAFWIFGPYLNESLNDCPGCSSPCLQWYWPWVQAQQRWSSFSNVEGGWGSAAFLCYSCRCWQAINNRYLTLSIFEKRFSLSAICKPLSVHCLWHRCSCINDLLQDMRISLWCFNVGGEKERRRRGASLLSPHSCRGRKKVLPVVWAKWSLLFVHPPPPWQTLLILIWVGNYRDLLWHFFFVS